MEECTNITKETITNILDFIDFGIKLYKSGICDKRIDGVYKLVKTSEIKGYTKQEAFKILGLSVRQFDRKISKGFILKGSKTKGDSKLYWDKKYIDRLSSVFIR